MAVVCKGWNPLSLEYSSKLLYSIKYTYEGLNLGIEIGITLDWIKEIVELDFSP